MRGVFYAERIPCLKMDFMFKQLFGQPSRKRITTAFLNDILNRTGEDRIIDVQFANTELTKDSKDGKENRLDVLVTTDRGETINVEVQVARQHYLPERFLYYWSRLYSSSIGSGNDYSNLSPTIMISIHQDPIFPGKTDKIHTIFHMREMEEQFIWSAHLEFHAIDLSQFMIKWKKYRRELKDHSPSELPWLIMLSAADYRTKTVDEEFLQELEEYAMKEQEIREALIEWDNMSKSKENKAHYEAHRKFLMDLKSNYRGEREEGHKEGLKEGLEKGRRAGEQLAMKNVAIELIKRGVGVNEIQAVTRLTLEELEVLQNTLKGN